MAQRAKWGHGTGGGERVCGETRIKVKLVTGRCHDAVLHPPSSHRTEGVWQQKHSLGLLLSSTAPQQRGHPEDTWRGGEKGGIGRDGMREEGGREG